MHIRENFILDYKKTYAGLTHLRNFRYAVKWRENDITPSIKHAV